MRQLEGKTVIITGAAQGLGAACARVCARRGANIVISDIKSELGEQVAQEIRSTGSEALFIQCDLRVEVDIVRLVDETTSVYGSIDGIVNNAIWTAPGALVWNTPPEDWDKEWRRCMIGAFLLVKHASEYLKESRGSIINISAAAGVQGLPGTSVYAAVKEGFHGLTRVWASEFGPYGVNVNSFCPHAWISNQAAWEENPETAQATPGACPVRHTGDPEAELAPVVAFLLSQDAKYITGQAIRADGGISHVR